MAKSAPLDTTIEVVTPENIGFRYHLAGPFRRLWAYLLDLVIFIGSFSAIVFLGFLVAIILGISVGGTTPIAFLSFGILIIFFVLSWFYGVFFETYYNGRTPGKWAAGIRVMGHDGHPISGKQALIRNLLRVADLAPPASLAFLAPDDPLFAMIPLSTGVVGFLSMLLSPRMQRLGDLAASTIVLIDERNWTLPVARIDDQRVPALASFIPADYRVSPTMAKALAAYAERRAFLSPGRLCPYWKGLPLSFFLSFLSFFRRHKRNK